MWKSRNLGFGLWQRASDPGVMPLQLSWTPVMWAFYQGEKREHVHTLHSKPGVPSVKLPFGAPVVSAYRYGILSWSKSNTKFVYYDSRT